MAGTNFIQVFIKLFDNKTLTLQLPTHETLSTQLIKQQIETLTQIPVHSQNLTLNGKFLSNSIPVSTKSLSFSTICLSFSLLGGKGGFGSLLRGAATKAGQKKTNNFDACRDMSGRRLRHVNAEKRLEEWKSEQEERRMEKVAEEYLKKMAKKGKGGKKDEKTEKYVEKYREDSARCVEEVERSVRESMGELLAGGKKRKLMEKLKGKEGADAKKLKAWMGKRKLGESDSESSDDDKESDSDTENEKSIIISDGNRSDSSKDGSSDSVSVPQINGDYVGGSSDSGNDEEKETATEGSTALAGTTGSNILENEGGLVDMSLDAKEKSMDQEEKLLVSTEMISTPAEIVTELDPSKPDLRGVSVNSQLPSTSNSKEQDGHQLLTAVPECDGTSECKSASSDKEITESSDASEVSQLLNFDDYNSAAELEVIGLERLKSELQAHGLKCGGTLKERASRLFMLKTTPVEKLPKKLLAKK